MNIEQISESDWNEICHPMYLCTLNYYPLDIKERYNLEFFEYIEDGLGLLCASIIKIKDTLYWLFANVDESGETQLIADDPRSQMDNREAIKVTVKIRSFERDSKVALDLLCTALSLSEDHLYIKSNNLGSAKWQLTRLDDNGNEIEMYRFLENSCARFIQKQYEKKGHKQSYYVREIT